MQAIEEAAAALERAAANLRNTVPQITLQREELTLKETWIALRAAVGPQVYLKIAPPTMDQYKTGEPIEVGNWTVWDGNHKRHSAPTLLALVETVQSAYAHPPTDPVKQLQKVLDGAAAPAF